MKGFIYVRIDSVWSNVTIYRQPSPRWKLPRQRPVHNRKAKTPLLFVYYDLISASKLYWFICLINDAFSIARVCETEMISAQRSAYGLHCELWKEERHPWTAGTQVLYIRIRAAGSICKEHFISSSLPERSCPTAEIEPSSATHGANERGRGEAEIHYRGQGVPKGSRSPTGSHMFWSFSPVSSVDCAN